MTDDAKRSDSAGVLVDMAEAHEEQPEEKIQVPDNNKSPGQVDQKAKNAPREDD